MPFLTIKTNGFSNDNKLVEKAANTVADVLGKPVNYVCAEIKYSPELAFAVENFGAEKSLVCIHLIDLPAKDVAHGAVLFG